MSRPIQALIHRAALAHNYQLIKQLTPGSKALGVIKADGYGHGVLNVAQALPDADGFAMLEISKALEVRQAGFRQPILLLEGVFAASDLAICAEHDLWIAIHDERRLRWLEEAVLPRPLSVFIKLNTGMNRLGFAAEQASELVQRLQGQRNVASISLMTHFATADEAERGIDAQAARFQASTAHLDVPVSLANSAACFAYPAVHGQFVRPGIALYGASPFDDARTAAALGLQPAMTLASRIIAVQHVAAGDAIGYGATFVAQGSMRLGIVACGYADGYPRHAPTGTPVLVNGRRTRLIGRISMDMLCVDLTDLPEADLDSPVELWGQQLGVDEVARSAGTIGYELLCAVAARVPRIVV